MKPRLTLAVPNKNGARFLGETLASLAEQGDAVQWTLQDGMSSDRSVEVARSLARPGDQIHTEPDSGQADAINRAIGRMGGDVIGWINSDDILVPGAAAAVLSAFQAHPEADMVVGEVDWIDAEGTATGHHAGTISDLGEMLDIYRFWWAEKQWVQPEVFWRRSLWEKAGPLDTHYHLAFDYDFWVRCLAAGARVLRIPVTLARFRIHDAQKSSASGQAADEIRTILGAAIAGGYLENPGETRRLARLLSYDRYQCGQEYPAPGSRPPLWQMLLRHPGWLGLPEVRQRLAGSVRSVRSRMP